MLICRFVVAVGFVVVVLVTTRSCLIHRIFTQAESYQLVKEMLEVALGALRAEEQKAFDHAIQARERQEKAVEEEHLLERQVKKAHDEVQEAHDEIASFHYKYLTNLDEWEMHRQLVNLDIAHRVEEYVARRLAETKAAESAAVHEEDEADEELLTLMTQQEELQAMLEELQQQRQQQPVAKKNTAVSDGKSSEAK